MTTLKRFSEISVTKRTAVTVLGHEMVAESCGEGWRTGTFLDGQYIQFGLYESKYQALQRLRRDVVKFANSRQSIYEQLSEDWMQDLASRLASAHDEILGLGILERITAKEDSLVLAYSDFEYNDKLDSMGLDNTINAKTVAIIDLVDIPEDEIKMNALGIDSDLHNYSIRFKVKTLFTQSSIQEFEMTAINTWKITSDKIGEIQAEIESSDIAQIIKVVLNGEISDWYTSKRELAAHKVTSLAYAKRNNL